MKLRGLPICTLTLLVASAGCNAPQKNDPTLTRWDQTRLHAALQLADEHIAAGKFERARAGLAAFESLSDTRLQLTLARMDVEEGHYAGALKRLETFAGSAAELPSYHRLRGVALEGLGRWSEAVAAYAEAYHRRPTVDLLTAWLETLVLEGQSAAASSILQRERSHYPGQPGLHVLAARLCALSGDYETAISEMRTAALAEPDSPEIQHRLADLLTAAGHNTEAAELWRKLLSESQDTNERRHLRHRLAGCLLSAGHAGEARRTFRALVLTQPEDEAARLGLAASCLLDDEPAEALEAALQLLRKRSDNVDARLIAAISYHRLNQPARATELLSDVRPVNDPEGLVRELLACWQ